MARKNVSKAKHLPPPEKKNGFYINLLFNAQNVNAKNMKTRIYFLLLNVQGFLGHSLVGVDGGVVKAGQRVGVGVRP